MRYTDERKHYCVQGSGKVFTKVEYLTIFAYWRAVYWESMIPNESSNHLDVLVHSKAS